MARVRYDEALEGADENDANGLVLMKLSSLLSLLDHASCTVNMRLQKFGKTGKPSFRGPKDTETRLSAEPKKVVALDKRSMRFLLSWLRLGHYGMTKEGMQVAFAPALQAAYDATPDTTRYYVHAGQTEKTATPFPDVLKTKSVSFEWTPEKGGPTKRLTTLSATVRPDLLRQAGVKGTDRQAEFEQYSFPCHSVTTAPMAGKKKTTILHMVGFVADCVDDIVKECEISADDVVKQKADLLSIEISAVKLTGPSKRHRALDELETVFDDHFQNKCRPMQRREIEGAIDFSMAMPHTFSTITTAAAEVLPTRQHFAFDSDSETE